MSYFTPQEADSLDRWITGNYGEDQFEDEDDEEEDDILDTPEAEEARELLNGDDHAVWSVEQAKTLAKVFKFPESKIPVRVEVDTRDQFKGLTLFGINPKTGKEFERGDECEIVDPLSMMYAMHKYLVIGYRNFFGRGFQFREYARNLLEYLETKGV